MNKEGVELITSNPLLCLPYNWGNYFPISWHNLLLKAGKELFPPPCMDQAPPYLHTGDRTRTPRPRVGDRRKVSYLKQKSENKAVLGFSGQPS